MGKVKKIRFSIECTYPVDLSDEEILDMFVEKIVDGAAEISAEDIEVVDGE